MSHPTKNTVTPSPLNALSNKSNQSYTNSSSNPILSTKLIPRDYLGTRTKPSAVASDAVVQQAGSSSCMTHELGTNDTKTPTFDEQTRSQSFEEENLSTDQTLSLEKTRSLESVGTTTSLESTTASARPNVGLSSKSLHNNMPRTSSIDSAISSASTSSTQRKDHGDVRDPSPSSIRNLISVAGSAESLVLHLLKEKNHAANQNNQLWKLVEKQRALLLGLNKDLERITKERDRYRKKLKEVQAQGVLPRAATQSPSQDVSSHGAQAPVKPQDLPQNDLDVHPSAAESVSTASSLDNVGPTIVTTSHATNGPLPRSNGQKPVLQAQTAGLAQPVFALTEATPLNEKPNKGFSASRKATPKPLNLMQSKNEQVPSTAVDVADEAPNEGRGRRKTREEDDREREKSLKMEQEARSKSKKVALDTDESEGQTLEAPLSVPVTLPASPRPSQGLAPTIALNAAQAGSVQERLLSLPLRSPGLPTSPRPMNNNLSTISGLPLSPRAPPPGPLSPRAPKQPIPPPMMSPSPFVDPAIIQRQNVMARQAAQQSHQPQDRLQVHEPTATNEIPPVFQGLVSPQYPNLLLPPNALPSIQIVVASSRLRPSRHSMLGLRTQEESTVFSLSIYSRASRNELWRIEKIPASLPQLDQQLRSRCKDLPKVPDRKLFSGHNPVVVDARRQALDSYFEELLDVEMDEPSALTICRFLSTDVLDPSNEPHKHPGVNQDSLPQQTNLVGKVAKTGFLTKRGKNFGGWKSRYFVLDNPDLRYYETPGGPQIGTIKVSHARISTQKSEDSTITDADGQYRHAFLIEEPKKKDSATFVRHVLCAESDADRDQWVAALLHYVEGDGSREPNSPTLSTNASSISRPQTASTKDRTVEVQSTSPSPTSPTSLTDTSISETMSKSTNISGPLNGAPIQDSTVWGNKATPQSKEKSSKMGNIFHFKKGSQEQLNTSSKARESSVKPRVLRHNGYVRSVFGLPLAEAVEYCAPFNIDVPLPAVVYRSIEYMRFRKAANEEGLFRLSGSNITVKTLKERFNTEGDVDLVDDEETYDVHAVASLFKTYLRELPSPLLTRDLHIEFLKVLEMDSQEEKVMAFNVLVHQLPRVNFELLRAMSEYLLEVTENAGKNKMSVRNMGIVFSPTVNIPTPVFNLFLSEFSAVFDTKPSRDRDYQEQIQQTTLRAPAVLGTDEIRSPRHQMFSDIPTPAYNQTTFGTTEASSKSHQSSGSGEFGFIPVHPSYESGQYVSDPRDPRIQSFSPPSEQQQQPPVEGEEQYGSLNRMIVPQGATTDKRRKRESAMLF